MNTTGYLVILNNSCDFFFRFGSDTVVLFEKKSSYLLDICDEIFTDDSSWICFKISLCDGGEGGKTAIKLA